MKLQKVVISFLLVIGMLPFPAGAIENNAFTEPLTQAEKQNIQYIINTLSSKSVFQLVFFRKKLQKAGDNVDHVHPLRFMAYVFSDPKLKSEVKRIPSMPWNQFVQDMVKSFDSAASRGEMKQSYIEDFAKKVGVNPQMIEPALKEHRWRVFMNEMRNRG